MAGPSVEVLRCPACGADVPLGQADDARCVHCGTVAPLPPAYRELRDLQRQDEATRRRAQALFSTLDTPPWLVTRVLAAVFDQPMVPFWLLFGVPIGFTSIFVGLAAGARFQLSGAAIGAISVAVIFAFAFLPRSIGIYANRRARGRRLLLSGLAAQAPRSPGGPACCRECGAPLDVTPGALVARCAYCGAESAVEVRTPLLARARSAARSAAHTVDEAVAIDRRERAATHHSMRTELLRYVVVTSIFGALWATWMWDDARVQARGDDSAPAIGLTALVLGTLLLIVLMLRSIGSDKTTKDEADLRRSGNDLPSWVRVVGPFGVWAVLWLMRIVIWR